MNAQTYLFRKFGSGSAVSLAGAGGATLKGVWISTKGLDNVFSISAKVVHLELWFDILLHILHRRVVEADPDEFRQALFGKGRRILQRVT